MVSASGHHLTASKVSRDWPDGLVLWPHAVTGHACAATTAIMADKGVTRAQVHIETADWRMLAKLKAVRNAASGGQGVVLQLFAPSYKNDSLLRVSRLRPTMLTLAMRLATAR